MAQNMQLSCSWMHLHGPCCRYPLPHGCTRLIGLGKSDSEKVLWQAEVILSKDLPETLHTSVKERCFSVLRVSLSLFSSTDYTTFSLAWEPLDQITNCKWLKGLGSRFKSKYLHVFYVICSAMSGNKQLIERCLLDCNVWKHGFPMCIDLSHQNWQFLSKAICVLWLAGTSDDPRGIWRNFAERLWPPESLIVGTGAEDNYKSYAVTISRFLVRVA